MKKKILNILLICLLIICSLIILSACGKKEDSKIDNNTNENKISNSNEKDNQSDEKEIINELKKLLNDKNFNDIIKYIDTDAFLATKMLEASEKGDNSNEEGEAVEPPKFEELYDFIKSARTKPANEVVLEYSDLIKKLNNGVVYSETELNEMIEELSEESDNLLETCLKGLEERFNSYDTIEITVDDIKDLKKIDETNNCYKLEVTATLSAKAGNNEINETDTDNFYFINNNGEYKIYSTDKWISLIY